MDVGDKIFSRDTQKQPQQHGPGPIVITPMHRTTEGLVVMHLREAAGPVSAYDPVMQCDGSA